MPWKENGWLEGKSIKMLAYACRGSHKTLYKWIARYESEGAAGLEDQSRAPQSSPQSWARR